MKNSAPVVENSPYFEQDIQARNEKVRSEIANRLKKACSYLTDAEFLVLVDNIANVQLVAERALAMKAYARETPSSSVALPVKPVRNLHEERT
jgi:hypothetical protein